MKFSFSSEQEEFRSNLRRFLADRSPTKEVRRLMETEAGWERDAWRKLNAELGLTAVRLPEAYGGQGNHQLSVADVDGDGRDEIIYGSMAIDDNGKGLWSARLFHGDAMQVGDLDRPLDDGQRLAVQQLVVVGIAQQLE